MLVYDMTNTICLSIMARIEAPLLSSLLSPTLQGRVRIYSVLRYDTIIASLIALLHRTPGTYNNIGPKKLLWVCYHFGLLICFHSQRKCQNRT